mgnify:CR=1 FL=1
MRIHIVLLLLVSGSLLSGQNTPQSARVYVQKNFPGISATAAIDSLLVYSERLGEEYPDSAFKLATFAIELIGKKGKPGQLPQAAWCAAEALYYLNEYKEAIDYYMSAAQESYKITNDSNTLMAENLAGAAFCYQELGIYKKALELNNAALRLHKMANNKDQIGDCLSNIGSCYFYLSEFDKAIEYFTLTLQADRQSGDSASIATSLSNLGMVYSRWGKHSQAIKFYEDALSYATSDKSKSIRYSKIGMSWYHMKHYDKALDYLNRALDIEIRYNQKIKIGIRKNEISTVISAMGRYQEALRLNEEALEIFTEADIPESRIITLTDMGNIYRKLGNAEKAEQCFLESISLAKKSESLYHQVRNYRSLYELAASGKDYEKAFLYFRQYAAISDSVFNTEKHEQLANFEILYKTEKKEKENQLLLLELQLKQKNQRLGIAVISGLLLILLLTYVLLRTKSKGLKQSQLLLKKEQELAALELEKKDAANKMLEDRIFAEQQINRLEREKHSATLELKNNELANSSLNIVRKNEILNEIRDRIKSSPNNEMVHEIIGYINSNTDIDHNWHKFKLEFDFIHPGFFDRIKSLYPQLTEHDTRLAAYLRINLSSREISGMMNVSLETVHKNRQRLRKKMNLEPNCDLSAKLKDI